MFPDAYDRFLSNELANEREADNIRNHVWEEHIRTHADGTTNINLTIAEICDTVEELRRENVELRERAQLMELQREEVRYHMQSGLGALLTNARERMYERIKEADIPEPLQRDVPELKTAA